MTEPYGYDEDDDQQDEGSEDRYARIPRDQIRSMEKKSKQFDKANEELTQMRRELALTRAGLGDLTERQQKALLANIDGDLTADSARQVAEELGFVQPLVAASDDDAAALGRMSQASAGASDSGQDDAVARLERVAREGGKDALLAQIAADGYLVAPAG